MCIRDSVSPVEALTRCDTHTRADQALARGRRLALPPGMRLTCQPVTTLSTTSTFSARVAIAIAAYNEAPHLAELVRRCVATRPARIVIVDDCSTDASAAVLAAIQAEVGDLLVVLRNPRNLGKQGSVRRAPPSRSASAPRS